MQGDTGIPQEDLEKVLASQEFARSERMARFLRFLVEHSRDPSNSRLKETEVGSRVFDRPVGYDPKIDSIVRVEATRLRKKLAAYYAAEGQDDRIQLRLPPGGYELEFVQRAEPVPLPKPSSKRWWPGAAAGLAAALLGWAVLTYRTVPASTVEAAPFTSLPGQEEQPAISPDGEQVAFTWDREDHKEDFIYVQRLGAEPPTRLTNGTQAELRPLWSPDGRELAFLRKLADERLAVVIRTIASGSENVVAELKANAAIMPGLSWSPDGQWLATAEASVTGPLHLVVIHRQTHEKRFFSPVSGAPSSRYFPVFSPDGKQIAFVDSPETSSADVFVAGFPDGGERRITSDHRPLRGMTWSADGRSLIVASYRDNARCSLWRIAVSGGAAPQRLTEAASQSWSPAVSARGRRLIFSRHIDNINIWRKRTDEEGPGSAWILSTGLNSNPQFSPDGKRVAFRSNRSGRSEIWVQDMDSSQPRRLTFFDGPVTGSPRWSPDGKRIAFDSRKNGNADVFIVDAAGGTPERLTDGASNEVLPYWAPDGKSIYFATDREGEWSVWRKPVAGGAEQMVLRHAYAPAVSADGRFLYYAHGPNEPGLFRTALGGEVQEPVIPSLRAGMWGNWALAASGLYFIDEIEPGHSALQRLGTQGSASTLSSIAHPIRWDAALTATPDGRTILYASFDRSDADLYVVNGFR